MATKYDQVIEWVFKKHYRPGAVRVAFTRPDLVSAHGALNLKRTSNIGDIPYTYRFRRELPTSVRSAAPAGCEWIITAVGTARYEFRLASPGKIHPSHNRKPILIPDATPEIIAKYAPGSDEQALLTRARYNRLVDVFSGLTCYSIQNHLRTTVPGVGQIEVDEVYVGLNTRGTHFVLPCQAKSPGDSFGIVQVMQDIALCHHKYPHAICRPIALKFHDQNAVAILELAVREEDEVFHLDVVDERLYRLVAGSKVPNDYLAALVVAEP